MNRVERDTLRHLCAEWELHADNVKASSERRAFRTAAEALRRTVARLSTRRLRPVAR